MLAHFDTAGPLKISFIRDVVDVMIVDLLLHVDEESVCTTRGNALSIFKLHANVEAEESHEAYYIDIATARRFNMVCGFVAKGESFQSASIFV